MTLSEDHYEVCRVSFETIHDYKKNYKWTEKSTVLLNNINNMIFMSWSIITNNQFKLFVRIEYSNSYEHDGLFYKLKK